MTFSSGLFSLRQIFRGRRREVRREHLRADRACVAGSDAGCEVRGGMLVANILQTGGCGICRENQNGWLSIFGCLLATRRSRTNVETLGKR